MAYLDGKQITTPKLLSDALKHVDQTSAASQAPELHDFDHLYSSDAKADLKLWQGGNATAAVLYATPGSECFRDMHKLLQETVTSQQMQGRPSAETHVHRRLLCNTFFSFL